MTPWNDARTGASQHHPKVLEGRRRRERGVLKTVWLALAAGAGLVLLAEGALRAYGFGRPILFRPERRLGWEMVPGQKAFNVRGRAPVRVNSLGFRGPEITPSKLPGSYRILYLGDGVTIANQTREESTYPFRVEQGLQDAFPERRIETLVGAVSGYQLEQELALLRARGLEQKPDLVIVGFCWNDWTDVNTMRGTEGPAAYAEYAGEGGWLRRMALYDFWIRLRNLRIRQRQEQSPVAMLPASHEDDRSWAHVGAWLDSITTVSRGAHANVLLVVLPSQLEKLAPGDYAGRYALLQQWAESRGVLFVDPRPSFAAASATEALWFDMLHFRADGHARVASSILQILQPQLRAPAATQGD